MAAGPARPPRPGDHLLATAERAFLSWSIPRGTMLVFQESCMGGFFRPIFFARTTLIDNVEPPSEAPRNAHPVNWLEAVERTVTALGYELVDTERSAGGLLRVYLDRVPGKVYDTGPGEFILVDDCEKVTRQLQHVLEVEACDYERLEVSSPGLDRPLKRTADYARFAGETIALTLKQPFQGRKKFQGVLQAADGVIEPEADNAWRLVFHDGKTEQALDFALNEVREARLVPVLDFKGRRFAPAPDAVPAELPATGDREDGGREQ